MWTVDCGRCGLCCVLCVVFCKYVFFAVCWQTKLAYVCFSREVRSPDNVKFGFGLGLKSELNIYAELSEVS